ncbi:tyrosine-type recombinase/integrase [Botrimarina mediterranea]|uniref:Tyrosine recombinase XerD n=1 Tax=Botrimarina mediterranea TaxID=2528022 RepID=A0A518K606_9BACT|nr:tyrosine-type recombinase/integrase [Botrimarina mediterranea]QDV73221.1 Tyrosine recombinase XerD [Botrimarina mediterranea]
MAKKRRVTPVHPVTAQVVVPKAPGNKKPSTKSVAPKKASRPSVSPSPKEGKLVLVTASAEKLIPTSRRNSLAAWFSLYLTLEVGAPANGEEATNTFKAKRADLERFIAFFTEFTGDDDPDQWTVATSKSFLKRLTETTGARSGKPLAPTTIDRVLATLRTAAKWIAHQRPFLAGFPMAKVKDTTPKRRPAWRGLPELAEGRLRNASLQLMKTNTRANQRPYRNHALLYVGLNSALRPSEILGLDLAQFDGSALVNVRCKGNLIVERVPLGKDAAEALSDYLTEERGEEPGPLFQSKTGKRLTLQKYADALKAIAAMANRNLPEGEKIDVSPHVLRHHTLRKLTREKGIEFAKKRSNHISDRHIWRYVEPSEDEFEKAIEGH